MNKSYLNSVKNTALSSKPSKAIRLLLVVLFICLFGNIENASAATRTASVSGNWNSTATWGGSSVPVAGDTVIINSGITVTVIVDAAVNSVSVIGSGILTINDAKKLTVYGNVDVASGAKFNAGTGNSDSATINVYGNFTNAGTANFWKSTVVIGGDLATSSTILQNNGIVIVGGNVSGVIGGSGSGIVYPVSPDAIVTVTGSAEEKAPGTLPPTGLLDLMNEVIYGTCSFTVNNVANVSACSGANAVFTVSTSASSPSFQWQINTSSGWADLTGETSASITLTSVTIGNRYRVKVTSSSCTKTGDYGVLTVNPSLSASISISASASSICNGASVTFTATPTNGGTTPTYQWKLNGGNVGTNSATYINATLVNDNTVTCVMTSNATCATGSPATSNTITMVVPSSAPSAPGAITGSTTQCANTTSQVYSVAAVTNATSYNWSVPSGWTITNGSGTNSITVTIGGSSSSGNVSVNAINACGTGYGPYQWVTVNPAAPTSAPVASAPTNVQCLYAQLNFTTGSNVTGIYLDIARDSGFTNFTGLTTYNNYFVNYNNGTIPVDNLPGGTLYYRVRAYNSCGISTNSNTISFSTTGPNGGTVSSAQIICSGTSPANLTLSGHTATNTIIEKWQKSADAAFTSPVDIANTTNTLTGTAIGSLTANTYFRAVVKQTVSPWCAGYSDSVLITVTPATVTPLVTLTQPTCSVSTGTIMVNTPVPAFGITYTVTGPIPATKTVTNSTGVFPELMAGTYNVTANNTLACGVSAVTSVTLNETVTNAWNGASWSNGTPNNAQKLVFSGNYPPAVDPNVDITGCSCRVTGGAAVTIKSGKTLTLTNEVTVLGGATLTFENNASLVQINNVSNSGDIDYKRITNARKTDYTYWSSPVSSQKLGGLYPLGGTFYSYEATASGEDWKQETVETTMNVGKGYIANRGAEVPSGVPSPPGLYNATFAGVPNNGTKSIAIGPSGTSNLLGNPYPSAINADLFLAANSSVLEGTIYFWTHNTAIQIASNITNGAGSGAYAYTSDDYASYNTTGGVGTTGNSINGVEQTANIPTGKIAAGQAFFTTSIAASGTVTFDNGMRVTGNNTQFFKTKNPNAKSSKTIEKNRIWLNLANTQGAFKQTLVGYITDATNDYDNRFDGESFDGNEFVDFYSVRQDKNLVIQGRALPFDENDEVQLGFKTTINGAFTINIDQVDGLLTNQAVFLEDKLTNTIFDLKGGNYNFNTVAGTFNNRFVLKYSDKTLGTKTPDSLEKTVLVSNKNKQIKIDSFVEMIDKVTVFDLLGRQVYQKTNVNSNELSIANLMSSHQTLVVKTLLQNGKIFTDKIIY